MTTILRKPRAFKFSAMCLALAVGLVTASASQAGVEWQISVQVPVQVAQAPVYAPAPVFTPAPQAFPQIYSQTYPLAQPDNAFNNASNGVGINPVFVPVQTEAHVQTPAPIQLPSVEHIQSQHAQRIEWGSRSGYLTGHEYRHLMNAANNIEYQRRVAYADGWFTYDEQVNLYSLLNQQTQQIEALLANRQTAYTQAYAAAPVFAGWYPLRPVVYNYWKPGYGHGHGNGHGYGNGQHQGNPHRPAPIQVTVPAPVVPNIKPALLIKPLSPPFPTMPHRPEWR